MTSYVRYDDDDDDGDEMQWFACSQDVPIFKVSSSDLHCVGTEHEYLLSNEAGLH